MKPRQRRLTGLLLFTAVVAACTPSPEDRIRDRLDEASRAVEQADRETVVDAVSESYADDRGLDKAGVLAGLGLFVRGRTVHLLHRVESVALPAPARAEAAVLVALVARPVDDFAAIRNMNADVYRLELELAEEDGIWRVTSAEWEGVSVADLF